MRVVGDLRKQNGPGRRTPGPLSVRTPGGIRTRNLSFRQKCVLSVELQRYVRANYFNRETQFKKRSWPVDSGGDRFRIRQKCARATEKPAEESAGFCFQ